MFKNFLKTTFRNLVKNKNYVIINILGLSLSLACCIVAYLNFKFAADYDKNHTNLDRIYKIQINKNIQSNSIPYGITPLPIGPVMNEQLPEIDMVTRVASSNMVLKKEQNVLNEYIGFVENNFFEAFTFPMKYGSSSSLADQGSIILSLETAERLFGQRNPAGEIVSIVKDDGSIVTKLVGGVLEKIPLNSTIKFDAFMTIDEYFPLFDIEKNSWKSFIAATFITLKDGQSPDQIGPFLNSNFIDIQNEARDDWKVGEYYLVPFSKFAATSEDLRANWLAQGPPRGAILIPMIMAILMLLIACFNFTNTSIAISSKRLKEIGIRKVMGGNKRQLILQFMGENLVLTLIALILSVVIAAVLVPAYSSLWEFIDLELDFVAHPELFIFMIGLLVFTSIVAGAYPSIYISSYEPVHILKGNFTIGGTSIFSRVLLSIQYVLTIVALIASLAFFQNADYQKQLDVGFEMDNLIAVEVSNKSEYDRLKSRVGQNPNVLQVASTEEHIGRWNYVRTFNNAEIELEVFMMNLGPDYLDIMGLEMAKGRYFKKDLYEHDKTNSLIVNEKLVEEFGWKDPIGQMVQIDDSTRLQIVGVIKNFYMQGFWNPVEPYGFRPAHEDRTNFAVVKVQPGELATTYDFLQASWLEVEPNKPFRGQYQDEFMRGVEMVNGNISIMFSFLGTLALILSSIGLYTLVSLNVIKRIKEIGVRKVLGATLSQIIVRMNRQFIWILAISAVLGSGLAYLAVDAVMGMIFAYYKTMSVITVVIPLAGLLTVAFCTSAGRTLLAARKNPSNSLRYE